MGINIYYGGSLSDPSKLGEALREIRDFCARAAWPCEDQTEHYPGVALITQEQAESPRRIDADPEPWPEGPEGLGGFRMRVSRLRPPALLEETATGVIVSPPESESLCFLFDAGGRLVNYTESPSALVLNAMSETVHYIAFPLAVKVWGGPATHAAICLLLRVLREKHLKNLTVRDETGFWKTGTTGRLARSYAEMSALTGAFRESIESGELLRALGMDIGDGKIRMLDSDLSAHVPGTKTKKAHVN